MHHHSFTFSPMRCQSIFDAPPLDLEQSVIYSRQYSKWMCHLHTCTGLLRLSHAVGRSLVNKVKRVGPSTDPGGIPLSCEHLLMLLLLQFKFLMRRASVVTVSHFQCKTHISRALSNSAAYCCAESLASGQTLYASLVSA